MWKMRGRAWGRRVRRSRVGRGKGGAHLEGVLELLARAWVAVGIRRERGRLAVRAGHALIRHPELLLLPHRRLAGPAGGFASHGSDPAGAPDRGTPGRDVPECVRHDVARLDGEGTFLERAGPAVTDAIPADRPDAILAFSPDGAIAREPNTFAAPSRRRAERPVADADGRVDARGTCIAHIATVIVSSTLPARQLCQPPKAAPHATPPTTSKFG